MHNLKNIFCLSLLFFTSFIFAEESVLIDFTTLDEQTAPVIKVDDTTTVSYAIPEWQVELNTSAATVNAKNSSAIVAAPVKSLGKNVLGVHAVFPIDYAASVKIVPPFTVPNYYFDENGKEKFENKGIISNVGLIKSIKVDIYGENQPETLYLLLADVDGNIHHYYIGSLEFNGWKSIIWNNAEYIDNVKARELTVYPIYPRGVPYVKFVGFEVIKDASQKYSDFIGYFKSVTLIYDKAISDTERDIDDESIWKIVQQKQDSLQSDEMKKLQNKRKLQNEEKEKQAMETDFNKESTVEK